MKRFILKIILFTILSTASIWGLLYYYHVLQKASLDPFYRRFTTGKFPSLILGSSRAAQGLRPDVFNQKLGTTYASPFFNYSFTVGSSNIGPNYLKKIKTRIKDSENGIFILCVNPWIMTKNIEDKNHEYFREENTFFAKQKTQGMSPNIEYMLFRDNKNKSFFEKIFRPDSSFYNLHENGWLQVNYDISNPKATDNSNWQIHLYREDLKKYILSEKRFDALEKIVDYLKTKGTIVLVRLPTSEKMKTVEDDGFPDFDSRINAVSKKLHVPYFNLITKSGAYQTVDGNHIYKDETERLSLQISELILEYSINNPKSIN